MGQHTTKSSLLKISRAVIYERPKAQIVFVRVIVALGHNVKLPVILEGVEDAPMVTRPSCLS